MDNILQKTMTLKVKEIVTVKKRDLTYEIFLNYFLESLNLTKSKKYQF